MVAKGLQHSENVNFGMTDLVMMERMGISASVSHLEDRILHVVNTRCQNI